MPKHDYTAKDALALLILKIDTASSDLAKRIRLAIDEGKDVPAEETIMPEMGRRKSKKRYYRKHVAYTDEEALTIAMTVLESHLIESRMLVNAAHSEFKLVGLASPKKLKPFAQVGTRVQTSFPLFIEKKNEVAEILDVGQTKTINIESEPETIQEKKDLPDLRFEPVGEEQLRTLREIFQALKALTNFQGASLWQT